MALDGASVTQILLTERIRLTASIWAVVRDTHLAEDLFQETVMRAIREPDQFHEADHVIPWALKTSRHLAIDSIRRQKRKDSILSELALKQLDEFWQTQKPHDVAARTDLLHECIEKLPEQSRELVRLRYEKGHSCSQVSTIVERTLTSVYKSLSRIHLKLRECVERSQQSPSEGTSA